MNIEETKKAIEVMQAFVDGKTVQCRDREYDNGWQTAKKPLWLWDDFYYRIKPAEPKEIWVNEYEDGYTSSYTSESEARQHEGDFVVRTAVHYREVIEE